MIKLDLRILLHVREWKTNEYNRGCVTKTIFRMVLSNESSLSRPCKGHIQEEPRVFLLSSCLGHSPLSRKLRQWQWFHPLPSLFIFLLSVEQVTYMLACTCTGGGVVDPQSTQSSNVCFLHAHPLSLHVISPIKLQCTLQLSGQIH
jgi:hypothetical protein